ncbi:MAG: hypothetical protein AAGH71_06130 [Planctomycetota bacterium]
MDAALLGGQAPVAERVPESAWILEESSACPRCGRTVTPEEVTPDEPGCAGCRVESLAWERVIRLGEYDGALRDAILETKYGRWRREGDRLGQKLGERLRSALADADVEPGAAVVVPVPMPPLRRLLRGIDHTAVMARGVARASGCLYQPLLSKRGGPTQTSVTPSARARNIRGRVRRTQVWPMGSRVVVLVDDVRTTGSTLHECCRALVEGLPKRSASETPAVWACVLATTPDPARRRARSGGLGGAVLADSGA